MSKKSIASFINFITRYPTQKSLIEELYLPSIIESYSRLRAITDIRNKPENQIRNDLERDLRNKNSLISAAINKNTIFMNTEGQIITESNVYRTDIKFSFFERPDFVIECKKLTAADNRYISGRTNSTTGEYEHDGIERFTESVYSENDNEAGMLAFVITPNVTHLMNALIEKVSNFKFISGKEHLLSTTCSNYTYSFQSMHSRSGSTPIHLYHLLLEM